METPHRIRRISQFSFVARIALSTATAYIHGITSDLSVICITFSLIVMYDASGVRREAGRQAQILNQLMEHFKKRNIPVYLDDGHVLKELLGHTPFEVFGGAFLGYAVASIIYYNFYNFITKKLTGAI